MGGTGGLVSWPGGGCALFMLVFWGSGIVTCSLRSQALLTSWQTPLIHCVLWGLKCHMRPELWALTARLPCSTRLDVAATFHLQGDKVSL